MSKPKLVEIAYEFKNLWNTLSKEELSDYYNVTTRTIYNYQQKLGLPKNTNVTQEVTNPITVYVQNSEKTYGKKVFKSWEHISNWFKAQRNPVIIDTLTKNNKKHVVCKFNKDIVKPDAIKLENSLK